MRRGLKQICIFHPEIINLTRRKRAYVFSSLAVMGYASVLTIIGVLVLYQSIKSTDLITFTIYIGISGVVLTIGIHALFVSIINIISLRKKKNIRGG